MNYVEDSKEEKARTMQSNSVTVNGCALCGADKRSHGQQYHHQSERYEGWVEPSDSLRKERMRQMSSDKSR